MLEESLAGLPEATRSFVASKVSYLGSVLSMDNMANMYRAADAYVSPYSAEGFNLPVLEAMACACPAITCHNSSLPEVGGDAVLYVDPDSVDAMWDALGAVQDPARRQELITKGLIQADRFSWRDMANTMESEFAAFSG
jgi:glycosyltransferase involved in cell wall biosynthesis